MPKSPKRPTTSRLSSVPKSAIGTSKLRGTGGTMSTKPVVRRPPKSK